MKKKSTPSWVGILLGLVIGFTLIAIMEILTAPTAAPERTPHVVYVQEVVAPLPVEVPEAPQLMLEEERVVYNFVEEVENDAPVFTEEQREILAIIIYQEAGADYMSDDTRRKVGSVFLNRVNSSMFPDTFYEVATAKRQYGRLYWTGIKWPDRASNPGEAHAVERAYRIAEELLTNGSILPGNVIYQAEFTQGDGIYCEQDGFYFCYSEVNK